jgi:hypothetical protein
MRHAWTNGFVERLQGTILSELRRVPFRRTYYTSVGQLERDLQAYLRFYNRERPHQGYRLQGRTPASVFWPGRPAEIECGPRLERKSVKTSSTLHILGCRCPL